MEIIQWWTDTNNLLACWANGIRISARANIIRVTSHSFLVSYRCKLLDWINGWHAFAFVRPTVYLLVQSVPYQYAHQSWATRVTWFARENNGGIGTRVRTHAPITSPSVCLRVCVGMCVCMQIVWLYTVQQNHRTCNTVRIREETLYVDLDEETFLKQVLVFGMLYINRVKLVHPDIKSVHLFRRIRILLWPTLV